jgi:hypothetical protein
LFQKLRISEILENCPDLKAMQSGENVDPLEVAGLLPSCVGG